IPNSTISQYLVSGPKGFLSLSGQNPGAYGSWVLGNLGKLMTASQIEQFEANSTLVPEAAGGGAFEEKNQGVYIEGNAMTRFLERDFRFNGGVRYVHTDQMLSAPLFLAGGVQEAMTQ